jgi:predicted O-linked N-acetylglucosamine transferase (SPINDLY family)
MKAVPDARLRLKFMRAYAEAAMRDLVIRRFSQRGIEPARIEFETGAIGRDAHLDFYSHVDVALDTFPYNGHTTTYDALSMGVPVITLQGRSFQSRVASSLLLDYQLAGNIMHSHEQYLITANQRVSELRSGKIRTPNLLEEASSRSKAQSFAELLTEARIVI